MVLEDPRFYVARASLTVILSSLVQGPYPICDIHATVYYCCFEFHESWQFLVVKPIGEELVQNSRRNGSSLRSRDLVIVGSLVLFLVVEWSRSDPKSKNNIDEIKPVAHL